MSDRRDRQPVADTPSLSRWRRRILALLWVIYAGFYLCRVNLAAAQADLARERRFTKRQLGLLISLLKAFYAGGQLINGVLSDRLGARRLLVTGLTVSAGLNLALAHADRFGAIALLWALNGYFQAGGWAPVVRTISHWFPPRLRDAASGAIGTSYILGSGLSWLLAGWLAGQYGWRYAFWVPPWLCLGLILPLVLLVPERPRDAGLPGSLSEEEPAPQTGLPSSLWRSRRLWAVAGANLALFFGYHGLLDWMPNYLGDVTGASASRAASLAALMPLGGALGCAILAVSSRGRRAGLSPQAVALPLVALACLTWVFPILVDVAVPAAPGGLLLLGALSSPPASLIACALPANIGRSHAAATAAGLVDAVGYAGSALSGWVTGRVMDAASSRRGPIAAWRTAWGLWSLGMVLAAGLVALAGRL